MSEKLGSFSAAEAHTEAVGRAADLRTETAIDQDFKQWEHEVALDSPKALEASPAVLVEQATDRIARMTPEAPTNQDDEIIDAEVVEDFPYDTPEQSSRTPDQPARKRLRNIGVSTLEIVSKTGEVISNIPVLEIANLAANQQKNPTDQTIGDKITAFGDKYVPDGWLANKIKEHGGLMGIMAEVAILLKNSAIARQQNRQAKKAEQTPPPAESAEAKVTAGIDAEVEAFRARTTAQREKQHADSVYDEAAQMNKVFSQNEAYDSYSDNIAYSEAVDEIEAEMELEEQEELKKRAEALGRARKAREAKLRRQQAREQAWNALSTASQEHWNQLKENVSNRKIGKICKKIAKWTRFSVAVGKGIGRGIKRGAKAGVRAARVAESKQ